MQPSTALPRQAASTLSLNELRHVALLTQTLSFGRAAQLAGISQSALSQSIAKIERTVGLPLFTRNRRSVNVTPFALLVTEHAEQVMHTMMNLHAHTEAMRDSRSGQLAFGIGIFAANHLLNPIMLKINERYPEASIQVVVGPPAELRDKLKNGDIEFFVAADDPEYHDDDTLRQKLYSEKLVIACRADHPLHRQDKISCLDLINYAAITYDGNFLKRQIYPLLSSAHEFELLKRNFPAIALQHPWLMVDFVLASDHIILSTMAPLSEALKTTELVALTLDDLALTMDMQIVQHRNLARTPLHTGVADCVLEVVREQQLD